MTQPLALQAQAHGLAAHLPPLLASAEHLARAVLAGTHGRRRAGAGDDFWQYRPAEPTDSRRQIDHRRSARGDIEFVREREWEIAQSVMLWVQRGASMQFTSNPAWPTKSDRSKLLSLSLAILLARGGERIGLGGAVPPRHGMGQVAHLAAALATDQEKDHEPLSNVTVPRSSEVVLISDFLDDLDPLRAQVSNWAGQGVRGLLYQVLDPAEEAFPYRGRTIFKSVSGGVRHETRRAADLRPKYLARLAEQKEALRDICKQAGWQLGLHHTDQPALPALLWLYRGLAGPRP